jgi:hypothetical protein
MGYCLGKDGHVTCGWSTNQRARAGHVRLEALETGYSREAPPAVVP